MRRFFQSFYGKLTGVFLLLLIVMGVVQILITTRSFINFNREVDQRLNLHLAEDMAAELHGLLDDDLEISRIGERIHYMMVMNPKIEIYLLDDMGKILAFFAEPGKSIIEDYVDLQPIDQFLRQAKQAPILGSDPRQPHKMKPFSVAQLELGEKGIGYLYIVIGGEQYDSTYAFFQNSYIIRTMIRGLTITLIFAGIIGLLLFALLTKRLRAISETVSDFERGNLEKRVKIDSEDEFGQLGKSFNQMADTIEETIEKLKQNDVLRRELIANVSHDLRTPLASIQGYVETILMKDDLGSADRQRFLEVIQKNTQNLSELVSELFALSKLEARQVLPDLETFAVDELVQDIVLKFQPLAAKSEITIKASYGEDLPRVKADIAMIDRVLSNLVRNAIQYTPAGGQVTVQLEAKETAVLIRVRDTGKGIAPEDLPHIFDRFYRGSKQGKSDSSSTGLGLTIAGRMIEAHGKKILVESQLSKGTEFNFELNAD